MPEEHAALSSILPEAETITSPAQDAAMAALNANFDAAEKAALERGEDVTGSPEPATTRARDDKGKFKPRQDGTEDAPVPEAKPSTDARPVAAPEAKGPEIKDPPEPDPEVDGLEKPKGMHPKKAEQWDALHEVARQRGREIKKRDAQIAEMQTAVEEAKKSAPLTDDERKRLKELEDFEFIHDPVKSGRITREFDAKLTAANDALYPLLKSLAIPEAPAEAKKLAEDIAAKSGQPVVPILSIEDIQKGGGIKVRPFSWWEASILNNQGVDGRTRSKIGKLVNEFFDTDEARKAALDQAPKDRETWQKQESERQEAANQQYGEAIRAEATKLLPSLGEWASPKIVPLNASSEQKAALEAHNKALNEKYVPAFQANLDARTPDKHAKVAMGIGSPVALYYQSESERLTKELAAAKVEADTERARADKAEGKVSSIKTAGAISRAKASPAAPKQSAFGGTLASNMADAGL